MAYGDPTPDPKVITVQEKNNLVAGGIVAR